MTKVEEMACEELIAVVTEYFDGSLPAGDKERFEAHLAECPYCVNYVEQMRATIGAAGGLSLDSIAPETRSQLVAAFRGWQERGGAGG